MTALLDDELLRRLEREVERAGEGSVQIRSATVDFGVDSQDEDVLDIVLTLAAPDGDTWPTDDILDTTRNINDLLERHRLGRRWVIKITADAEVEYDESESTS